MNLAGFTVRRPVLTLMVTLISVTIGLMALSRLPIDLLPDITYPTITVTTEYPNAGPEEVEQLITRPVEEAVGAVEGVEEISSTSTEGSSNVRIAFGWGTNLEEASNDIRDRLERIIGALPDDADRPRVRKFDAADTPILLIGVAAPLDPIELRQLVDDRIRPRLERQSGVAAVDVWGGLEREIRVDVQPQRMQALGLDLQDVRDAIRDANVIVPGGDIMDGLFEVRVRTPGEFRTLDDIATTVIDVRNGAPVTIGQVADVQDTHQRVTRIIRINDDPGLRLAVRKQSDANTVEVARNVNAEIERLARDYPQLQIVPAVDNAAFIQRSIDNVSRSILYGGSLAVLVLLFFLRNIPSTLVAATAIPVSVIATFALIYFGGFTLNLMTLGGLALGVGLMVDNAIVVIENITRRRRDLGEDQNVAAVAGTGDVAAAIIASTLTTLAIFLPMFFAQELAGVLFRQLAYVVAFALFCSLLVALTLVPMLMARPTVERAAAPGFFTPLANGCGRLIRGLERGYLRALEWVLGNRAAVLLGAVILFVAAIAVVPRLGTEFMPATDDGEVRVTFEMEPGTRLDVIDEQVQRAEAIIGAAVPELQNSVVSVGSSTFRASSPARADITMSLVPRAERDRSSEDIANDLRRRLTDTAGATVRVRASQGMVFRRLGGGGEEQLEIDIQGFELETLDAVAREVADRLEDVPGITDIALAREDGTPQELVRVNRERAADLGLSVGRVARTVETALGGSTTGQFRDGGSEHPIRVQLQDARRMSTDDLLALTIPGLDGDNIALRNVVTLESAEGPIQIFRKEQQRLNTVSANVSERDLGSVVADARAALADMPLPRGVDITFAGDYEEQEAAFSELGLSMLLAIALVYMVLASLYESFRDPLIVMGAVPMAAIGVVGLLLATGTTLNTQSLIGCIMLVGIAVNNAILLVDQSARLRAHDGFAVGAAVREAARRRLRPILMTSLTTILALLPLALGVGEGGEAQAPMARAVIGGLLSSTVIALFVIPVLYTLFHREHRQ
ncbi:efflux RND transporter permease subunit [Aquisalimonas asiatica]|uniref:Hydrophobic/amphiphilic exporter-1, HAE1 family n=1 Tax=Aquisalimonas asiatica TaxID=406100 RepID=A0A1H8V314_9GAMM|nr:efflux RND transporter permease subunit [Aquisalimonas asiatica]SEP09617.1 hydrophobic/amphiphilic exporter-1, HAE1 family [Aquisalimonas asiatica]